MAKSKKPELYWSGGIGDCLVLESHWPTPPKVIHWRSRARPDLQPLFELAYPKVRHVNLLSNLTEEEERYAARDGWDDGAEIPEGVEDWTVQTKFPEFKRNPEPWHRSRFLDVDLADLARFRLPERYFLCQHDTPYNGASVRNPRQISGAEWDVVRQKADGLPVVVVGSTGSIPCPGWCVDLVGKTTLAESVEILKGASGYLGIDSALAVLAAQLFDADHLLIKWHGQWLKANRDVYYSPHTTFPFLQERFMASRIDPKPKTVKVVKPLVYRLDMIEAGVVLDRVPAKLAADWMGRGMAIEWGEQVQNLQSLEGVDPSALVYVKTLKPVVRKIDGMLSSFPAGAFLETPPFMARDWIEAGLAVLSSLDEKTTTEAYQFYLDSEAAKRNPYGIPTPEVSP